jgi:glycosyltransferase involved in cell wall biosynthesis
MHFKEILDQADHIIAACEWMYNALILNGASKEKIVLSRQGVDTELVTAFTERFHDFKTIGEDRYGTFRVLYLGRWAQEKGIEVLIRAFQSIPSNVPVELVICGLSNSTATGDYEFRMRQIAREEPRIKIMEPVPREQLVERLCQVNAIAVPSLSLETGPLVVLEAKAARLPVIGSRLGGIAELVQEPEDGVLVSPGDVHAWSDAILNMARAPRRAAVSDTTNVRTMANVASEMAALYYNLGFKKSVG